MSFAGSQTLNGSGTVVFGDSAANDLVLGNAGTTLVIGSGITVRGQDGTLGGGAANVSVVNQGTISADDVSGGTITINAEPFSNQGLAQGVNGGTLALAGSWSNSGTFGQNNGAISLGGTFTGANIGALSGTNGQINVTGRINNSNTTLVLNGAVTSWVLNGGTISGGTVVTTNGSASVFIGQRDCWTG